MVGDMHPVGAGPKIRCRRRHQRLPVSAGPDAGQLARRTCRFGGLDCRDDVRIPTRAGNTRPLLRRSDAPRVSSDSQTHRSRLGPCSGNFGREGAVRAMTSQVVGTSHQLVDDRVMTETTQHDLTTAVRGYFECWNAPDHAARFAAIERTWALDATSTDPVADVSGHAAIAAMMAATLDTYPGHRFAQLGDIDGHHDMVRWGWEMVDRFPVVMLVVTTAPGRCGCGR